MSGRAPFPNALNRFPNFSRVVKEADGLLKIAVGPKPVAGVAKSIWLPPSEGKPFSLTFRTYLPTNRGVTLSPLSIENGNACAERI